MIQFGRIGRDHYFRIKYKAGTSGYHGGPQFSVVHFYSDTVTHRGERPQPRHRIIKVPKRRLAHHQLISIAHFHLAVYGDQPPVVFADLDSAVRQDEVELHGVVPLNLLFDKRIIELPFPAWVLHHVPVSADAHAEVDAWLLIHTLLLFVPHILYDDVVY